MDAVDKLLLQIPAESVIGAAPLSSNVAEGNLNAGTSGHSYIPITVVHGNIQPNTCCKMTSMFCKPHLCVHECMHGSLGSLNHKRLTVKHSPFFFQNWRLCLCAGLHNLHYVTLNTITPVNVVKLLKKGDHLSTLNMVPPH